MYLYTDDAQLYCASETDSSVDTTKSIESCINDIRLWMISNKLKINNDKTEFLVISSSHLSFHFDKQLTIGDATISQFSSCHSSNHFHLRNIGTIQHALTESAAAQLVHSLVTSRLDYCNSLLYGLPDTQLDRLQQI